MSLIEVKMLVAQLRTWPVQESRARLLLKLVSKRLLCHSRKDSLPVGRVGNNLEEVATLPCSLSRLMFGRSEDFDP